MTNEHAQNRESNASVNDRASPLLSRKKTQVVNDPYDITESHVFSSDEDV